MTIADMNEVDSDVMTPRIFVRDGDDMIIIVDALRLWMIERIKENRIAAALPEADQYALSMDLISQKIFLQGKPFRYLVCRKM